jgi:opacity protein-like surface antigen
MKNILLAAALVALIATPALAADDCQKDIEQIDAALEKTDLQPDEKAEVTDMRSQAVQLCGAGNIQEGLDVTAEVKARLSIE